MNFNIKLRDINKLSDLNVTAMYTRLSTPDRNMRAELEKRYIHPEPGPHESIMLALVWCNEWFGAWVGTRKVREKFKGNLIDAQSIECFTDPELRQRGFAQLGLQALISAGVLDREKPVAVYRKGVIAIAARCGCKTIVLCEP